MLPLTVPVAVMNLKSSPESSIASALMFMLEVWTVAFPSSVVVSVLLPAVPDIKSAVKVISSQKIIAGTKAKIIEMSFFILCLRRLPCQLQNRKLVFQS